ncbi:MAG TPA: cation:proton antiporter [Gammaproteobacteria bacterium]|nr:cation:proton antiporter [Gammaproteobacteria bacterium]
MHEVAFDLLILLAGIWLVAVTLRPLGLPTVMGELIVGVVLGPAALGLIEPSAAIQLLAEIGIFFLMFHAGVETQPLEFYDALKRSLGVAVVGAIVPFTVSFCVALAFGLGVIGATFVGLTMTATAVVITLKSLKDLDLANTRVARVIVASCVIDDLLTLVFFGLVIGMLSGGAFEPVNIVVTLGKVVSFFAFALLLGRFVYPRLTLPFRSEGGKGFTFVLLVAIASGLVAEAIGLHMIIGAYLAGLFFEEKVAHPNLVRIVKDRAYGIAYSFLGPIFFISLGFSISFDISAAGVAFIALLTTVVIVGQIVSAGGMALRMGLPPREALTVGVGMCGRAEIAFILASLALAQGAIDQGIFTALIFTAFLLNLFTPLALKGCAGLLQGRAARQVDATSGIVQLETFGAPLVEERYEGHLLHALPDVESAVVIYGYGPEVDSLMGELASRGLPMVVVEADETVARRLHARGVSVVHASLADETLDLRPLAKVRAVVANAKDDHNALLAVRARELGFGGPIVALIDNPNRRGPMQLAGATAAFTPNHVLAAAIAVRASATIGPRITGVEPLGNLLEIAEIRVHDESPFVNKTLADSGIYAAPGVHIVGQWVEDGLQSPPAIDQRLQPGMILVAAGTPDSIQRLREIARPITQEGTTVVAGFGAVGSKLVEMLRDASEEVCVISDSEQPGVEIVGDVLDTVTLERAGVATARVVILACESDSATLLAATVVRNYAPDVPIVACAALLENVGRIQQAGADYALSVSQVAGQLLAYHVLGEMVSQQARIKLVKIGPGLLIGHHPQEASVRERTGCSVIAVERRAEVIVDIPGSFVLADGDALYVCGTVEAVDRFYEEFAESSR